MSSVHPYPTQMEDRECIIAGIKQLGFNPTVLMAGQTQKLRRYGPGNTGYIGQEAEIIIPKEQINWASNDIGFRREANGKFTVIASVAGEYNELGPKWIVKMKQAYSEQKLMAMYREHGYTSFERKEIQTENGTEVSILAQTPHAQMPNTAQLGFSR
jgi:hypothetical protein